MKKFVLGISILAVTTFSTAQAVELTGNVGLVSEYVFRGLPSSDGKAAAQGGLDLAAGGFYAGTWVSTVDFGGGAEGVEIDLYGGYGLELGEFALSAGGTYYTYTDQADEDYIEANLSAGWRWFTVDVAIGDYDSQPSSMSYQFYSLTGEWNGLYATYGLFEDDFDGEYLEVGYGDTLTVGETDLFDYSLAWIWSSDDYFGGTSSENTLVFGIVRNFDIPK